MSRKIGSKVFLLMDYQVGISLDWSLRKMILGVGKAGGQVETCPYKFIFIKMPPFAISTSSPITIGAIFLACPKQPDFS